MALRGLRHGRVISKPSVWQLWFKVVAATLPVLIISPLDDWFEARFYNYITVAAMLILYGVLFIVVWRRTAAPRPMWPAGTDHLPRSCSSSASGRCWPSFRAPPVPALPSWAGLLLGLSRACVAEFTFYLAIPVMAGASLLKVISGVRDFRRMAITGTEIAVLVVGCAVGLCGQPWPRSAS